MTSPRSSQFWVVLRSNTFTCSRTIEIHGLSAPRMARTLRRSTADTAELLNAAMVLLDDAAALIAEKGIPMCRYRCFQTEASFVDRWSACSPGGNWSSFEMKRSVMLERR